MNSLHPHLHLHSLLLILLPLLTPHPLSILLHPHLSLNFLAIIPTLWVEWNLIQDPMTTLNTVIEMMIGGEKNVSILIVQELKKEKENMEGRIVTYNQVHTVRIIIIV